MPTLPLALANSLHAERALFHDTFGANGDIRVQILSVRVVDIAFPEVEETHMVRTIVGAVARSNAAVVDLNIQALLVVVRSVHRAHGLTGGIVAVLAEHRQEARLYIGVFTFPIALYANPVHRALLQYNVLKVERDVVFRMASDDASLATGAAVEIHYHTPASANACHRLTCVLFLSFCTLSQRRYSPLLMSFVRDLERLFIGHLHRCGYTFDTRQSGSSPSRRDPHPRSRPS